MNKKKILATLTILAILPLASATITDTSVEYTNDDITVTPAEDNYHADIEIQFNDTAPDIENIENQLDFNATLNNTQTEQNTFSSELILSPPARYPATEQPQTEQITLEFPDNTTTLDIDYEVETINQLEITPEEINANLSVGDRETIYETVQLEQIGNIRSTTAEYQIQGNITELTRTTEGEVEVFRSVTEDIILRSDIAENQDFGHYEGELNITNNEEETLIPVEINVDDNIPPSIEGELIPEIQATQEKDLTVEVTDNLEIENVFGEVHKITDTENGTEKEFKEEFFFSQDEGDSSLWNAEFTESSETGNYSLDIRAEDTSGNEANRTFYFQIEELNSVAILEEEIVFDAVAEDDTAEREFLQINESTPVDLELEFFSHDQPASNIVVGVRNTEEEQIATEYTSLEEGANIEIEEAGTYTLEVSSNTEESFRGRINVQPREEHVEVGRVQFQGLVIDPIYPEPTTFSLGSMEGEIGFVETNGTVQDRIEYYGTVDADRCRGVNYWAQCLSSLDLGALDDAQQQIDEAESNATTWYRVALASWVILAFTMIFTVRKNQLAGQLPYHRKA